MAVDVQRSNVVADWWSKRREDKRRILCRNLHKDRMEQREEAELWEFLACTCLLVQ
jgi:hypothetical protein